MTQKQPKQPKHDQGQPKMDLQMYNNLVLRKRLLDKQLANIKQMTYHDLLDKSRSKKIIQPPSPTAAYARQKLQQDLLKAGVPQSQVEHLATRQLQMIKQTRKNNAIMRRQMRQAPIWSQIKRGKLGFDSVLILFGIFGSITLPIIFYHKFKKNKQIIINSRGVDPQVIENLTQDSPIDIDSVSQQSIHYDNPQRRKRFQEAMQSAKKIAELKKDLDL